MQYRVFGDSGEFREAPVEFVVVRKGENRFTINGKQSTFVCDDEDAELLCKEFCDRAKDLVVDWDHATLDKRASAEGDAPAAGWVKIARDTAGNIVAKVQGWTEKAKSRFLNGEYRYISPVLAFDGGKPKAIQSIGITNHPAIHGSMPLVAASDALVADEPVDEAVESVLKTYEDMVRKFKAGVAEEQEMLRQCIAAMHDLGDRNPGAKLRIEAFTDSLFAEDLKAFQDSAAVVVPSLADVQANVQAQILQNRTVDAIAADTTLTIGQRASMLADMLSKTTALLNQYNAMMGQVTDDQKPNLAAVTEYLAGFASEIQKGISRLDAVATDVVAGAPEVTPMADTNPESAKQDIVDKVRKMVEKFPMQAGELVKSIMDELKQFAQPTPGESVTTIAETPAVPEIVQKMHDLCLTKDCKDGDLLLAMSDAMAAKQERDGFLAKTGIENLAKAKEKLVALNDAVRKLEATVKVNEALSSKKLTVAMKDWAIEFATRDPKGFDAHVAKSPVMFNDLKVPKDGSDKPRQKAYSAKAVNICKQFGRTPEELDN